MLIKLLSYQSDEVIAARALLLWRPGRVVDTAPLRRLAAPVGEIVDLQPAVIVFDCDRLPIRAKEVAESLRVSRGAGSVPLLFAGGHGETVDRLQEIHRRAVFASWAEAPMALDRLLGGR